MELDGDAHRTHLLAARALPDEAADMTLHERPRVTKGCELIQRPSITALSNHAIVALLDPLQILVSR